MGLSPTPQSPLGFSSLGLTGEERLGRSLCRIQPVCTSLVDLEACLAGSGDLLCV